MYQDFFSLQQLPFSIAPDPDFLFFTKHHKEALAHLTYGLQGNGGFVVLTGERGTGKTSICKFLLQEFPLDTDIASINKTEVSEVELLIDICDQFSIRYDRKNMTLKVMFDALASWMLVNQKRGRHAIVLIDEAQHLSFNALEQLRLITNIEADNLKPLQIILIGQSSLQKKLLTTELRQLSQRITARYHLPPMNKQDCSFYIQHRLNKASAKSVIFPTKTIAIIFKASSGIPLLINQVCDRCLMNAYTQSSATITQSIAKKAIEETELAYSKYDLEAYIPHIIACMGIIFAVVISLYMNYSEEQTMQQEWQAVINTANIKNTENASQYEIVTSDDTHQEEIYQEKDIIESVSLTPKKLLHAIPKNNFSLQLAALANKQSVTLFFETYPTLKEKSYLYHSLSTKKSNYIILLGNFAKYNMAKQAAKTLTTDFPKIKPWIKNYRTIQSEIE